MKKFFDDCKQFVIIEDGNGNCLPPNANKKNKIIISNDKNKVSIVNEII